MAAQEKNPAELEKATSLAHVPKSEEFDKMISGMLYDAHDPELSKIRFNARRWMHKYNNYFPDDPEADFESLTEVRKNMLKQFLGHVGDEVFIEPSLAVDYGCNIRLGDRFYSNFNLTILDCALVTIGDRVMFGPNVSILTATHETEVQSRRDDVEYAKPITIEDDCWIGGHVVILPGVIIGQGCTIAASSVVTKNIPAWSVAMGAPARVVKKVTPLEAHS
ncbi:trimeric LpxA-like protein [Daldinia loculata]|uniref:trimeric LpxA-like protein n=1 Tax=Daldinia loculata TaxID=103429 RepID=UPI0020C59971|nr:trimeric LpxA-like protein [Daldinia loculata]KAI1646796.1 trimeric LpxA-like protein [Daldinia loculata]